MPLKGRTSWNKIGHSENMSKNMTAMNDQNS